MGPKRRYSIVDLCLWWSLLTFISKKIVAHMLLEIFNRSKTISSQSQLLHLRLFEHFRNRVVHIWQLYFLEGKWFTIKSIFVDYDVGNSYVWIPQHDYLFCYPLCNNNGDPIVLVQRLSRPQRTR